MGDFWRTAARISEASAGGRGQQRRTRERRTEGTDGDREDTTETEGQRRTSPRSPSCWVSVIISSVCWQISAARASFGSGMLTLPHSRARPSHVLTVAAHSAAGSAAHAPALVELPAGAKSSDDRVSLGWRVRTVRRKGLSAGRSSPLPALTKESSACPQRYCWHSWKNATQMPAMS